jgi:HlyD family secretion protein
VAFTSEPTKGDSHRTRVLAPKPALVQRDGKSGVYLVVEGRAKFEPVETGGEVQGQMEITKGLQGGERLIVLPEGVATVRDGDRVRVEGEKE